MYAELIVKKIVKLSDEDAEAIENEEMYEDDLDWEEYDDDFLALEKSDLVSIRIL